jgi:putative MATE family efflux protein
VADHAEVYLRVSLFGLPALLVSLAGVGFLRGRQDTRTPLLVALGTAVANGVLEALLIFRFDQGIGASALSTVLAQAVAAVVFAWQVTGDARRLGAALAPDPGVLLQLLAVGGHLIVRTAALRGSLLLGVAVAARIGTADVAAYEIAFQLWSLAALALDALAIAAQTLVGHALGAGDADAAREYGRRAMLLSLAAGAVIALVLVSLRVPLASIFSDDPTVEDLAAASLVAVALIQPVNGLAFALDGILIGAGDQRFLAFAMTIPFALFSAAALAVWSSGAGLGWLWAALSLFMVARWLVLHARFRTSAWLVLGGGS